MSLVVLSHTILEIQIYSCSSTDLFFNSWFWKRQGIKIECNMMMTMTWYIVHIMCIYIWIFKVAYIWHISSWMISPNNSSPAERSTAKTILSVQQHAKGLLTMVHVQNDRAGSLWSDVTYFLMEEKDGQKPVDIMENLRFLPGFHIFQQVYRMFSMKSRDPIWFNHIVSAWCPITFSTDSR